MLTTPKGKPCASPTTPTPSTVQSRILARLQAKVAALDTDQQRTLTTDYVCDLFEHWLAEELVGYIDDVKRDQLISDKSNDADHSSTEPC